MTRTGDSKPPLRRNQAKHCQDTDFGRERARAGNQGSMRFLWRDRRGQRALASKVNDGEDRLPDPGQRGCRQDHHPAHHHRSGCLPNPAALPAIGHDLLSKACEQDRHAGHGPCAGRPPRVHPHERAGGEPGDGRVQSQRTSPVWVQDLEMVFDYFPAFEGTSPPAGQHLSGSEQQMVAMGRALR